MGNDQYSVADLRRRNRNRVYRYLYQSAEPRTVQDVARALSMSLPTVNQNLNELLEQGLIDNSGIAGSTGGRRPRVLTVVPGARFAVGVELSPRHIRMAAVDLKIGELGSRTLRRRFSASREYGEGLARDVEEFLDGLPLGRERLLGVGIALPGIVDPEGETLENAPTLDIRRQDIGFLRQGISCPVRFCNDANAGGFAEWWDQADLTTMAYLSLSRGVGGAILINGVPYEGLSRRSGEFGHMCIHPNERACSCGRRGCLEAYCSTAILSDDLGLTLEEFFAGLAAGEERLAAIWDRYLDDLAIGVGNIRAMLDCGVVLGGALSQHLAGRMSALTERLDRLDPAGDAAGWVRLCRYHGRSSAIGAALWFVDRFLGEI